MTTISPLAVVILPMASPAGISPATIPGAWGPANLAAVCAGNMVPPSPINLGGVSVSKKPSIATALPSAPVNIRSGPARLNAASAGLKPAGSCTSSPVASMATVLPAPCGIPVDENPASTAIAQSPNAMMDKLKKWTASKPTVIVSHFSVKLHGYRGWIGPCFKTKPQNN